MLTKNNTAIPGDESGKESKDGDVRPDLLEDSPWVGDCGNGNAEEAE